MGKKGGIKIAITVLLIVAILCLSIFIYNEINTKGVDIIITGVEGIKEKDTPELKEPEVVEEPKQEVIAKPEPVIDKVEEDEDKPSIIVDNPIRRTQDTTKRDDNYMQSDEYLPSGTIIGEVGTVEIIPEVIEREFSQLELIQKDLQEKAERNKDRLVVGLEVVSFKDLNEESLNNKDILSKGTVIIPWYATDVDSVKYTKLLNSLYTDYGNELNIIFVSELMSDKDIIRNVIKDNAFTFKPYYDASGSFFSLTKIKHTTEVLFINEDDYLVHKFTVPVDEATLRAQFEKLINQEY